MHSVHRIWKEKTQDLFERPSMKNTMLHFIWKVWAVMRTGEESLVDRAARTQEEK